MGIPVEILSGFGEIGVVVQSAKRDGSVPRGGEVLGAVTLANAAVVFGEGHIADVVQAVLNASVAPVVSQQFSGIRLRS